MYCVKKINSDLYWVGGSDRRIALFENAFPVPNGVSYNSYLLIDEKTVLFDTVDHSISDIFFDNIAHVLDGRSLDYLVINHMEPDHCASIRQAVMIYPDLKIVCNDKTVRMIKQFFDFDIDSRVITVKENDTFSSGRHEFTFVMAPMVHWPEVMVTYDLTDKILFSADAFGTFGALNGNIFADELDFETHWIDDARRYYTNIVGKYGPQVQALLKKASSLEISMICPLHGPVFRENIGWFVDKYQKWSTYTPEENSVLIAYASVYGNTKTVAEALAFRLADKGIKNIQMYDVSVTHPSYIVSDCFKYSHLVFASTTYNAGIFTSMENLLMDLKAHNLQNRTAAVIQNGSWAPTSGKLMTEILSQLKNVTILDGTITIKSSMKDNETDSLDALADNISKSVLSNR
ncbi:MAG: FprA family A-type flavoprotein [Oscillospiraceae bacterium]|nr:FprA family A-type flavoprotein [Oscillospiraceae bacterium]